MVRELGQVRSEKAIELLSSVATDDFDPEIKRVAWGALSSINSEQAADALLALLKNRDDFVAWEAAKCLGSFSSEKVVDGLIEASNSPFLRSQPAILSLGRIGSDRAVEQLVRVLLEFKPHKDMDSYYAMEALVRLASQRAVDGLIDAWLSDVSITSQRLYLHLAQMKPKRLIEPLCRRLQNSELAPAIRKASAEMLGLIGTENEIPVLESIWRNSDVTEAQVGWSARRAAEQISYEELKRKTERERALEETRAFIGHEFRHALAPLNAYTKMLAAALSESAVDKKELAALVHRIQKQTDKAFELVNQYLDYSRPLDPVFVEADINRLLQESLDEIQTELQSRNIRLRIILEQNAKASVDPTMLTWVLRNILANAVDAIDQDGDLLVESAVVGEYTRIVIRDSGTGIEPALLSKVFDIGYTTKLNARGSGFGLALAKRIVEAHGGSIQITNNENGSGASVSITLPNEHRERTNGRQYSTLIDRG